MAFRKRKMLWAPFGIGNQALAASAAVSVDMLSLIRISVPSINNFTVVRTRGFCGARPDAVSGDARFFDVAMTVITQPAFDAGAAPDPENDDASYMYRETIIWTPILTVENAAGAFVVSPQLLAFDVKAKRRVDQADNTLVFVIKNRQAVASTFLLEGMALLNFR